MFSILIMAIIYFFISLILCFLALSLGNKSDKSREKLSPFECGFDPFKKARVPFSLRFFLITIIFLVFDVEIALLLPLGLMMASADLLFVVISGLVLAVILILGLVHEWNQGALTWIY
uniref:NADH-ubiquinone oxidoreductase chain 3 n=1 Tax=Hyalella franciscae TaxID=2759777 RepID=A0A7T8V7F6_9CRUS|nr:NADH dehydrogenase subunit 3 [Hyalella franciscae]